jgi:hypothetical protein
MAYQASGDLQSAAAQLAGAAAIGDNPLLYAKLEDIYLSLGEQGLAQEAFGNAALLDPSYAGTLDRKLSSMNGAISGG